MQAKHTWLKVQSGWSVDHLKSVFRDAFSSSLWPMHLFLQLNCWTTQIEKDEEVRRCKSSKMIWNRQLVKGICSFSIVYLSQHSALLNRHVKGSQGGWPWWSEDFGLVVMKRKHLWHRIVINGSCKRLLYLRSGWGKPCPSIGKGWSNWHVSALDHPVRYGTWCLEHILGLYCYDRWYKSSAAEKAHKPPPHWI